MSKKTPTKKPSKTTTKKAPAPQAKPSVAHSEAKKPAEPKKQAPAKASAPPTAAKTPTAVPATSAATKTPTAALAVPAATKTPAAAPATPAATKTPTAPDPRLPAPGTLIQKRDRRGAVRCECTVEEGGIRYAGSMYRSLSAAAMAAAKDLGLNNKTQNGFTFWGLTKPPRRASDPLAALERAWTRYYGNVEALVKSGVTDENRSQVLSTIKKHVQEIESLRQKAA